MLHIIEAYDRPADKCGESSFDHCRVQDGSNSSRIEPVGDFKKGRRDYHI